MISTPVFALAIPGLQGVGIVELLIVLAVVLLLFGPKRLPALGKSLGKTFRSLKDGIEGKLDEGEDASAVEATTAKKAEPASADAKKPAASADKSADEDA